MDHPAPRRPGCLRILVRGALILFAAGLGVLAWDVWQLQALRPPADCTFEGFLRSGREGSILIDAAGDRLYWTARPAKTLIRYTDHVYEFNRAGLLVNWTPGTGDGKGMLADAPVRKRGAPATLEQARAWMRKP
ncbi:MAG: hypothetical protein HY293_17085 [Planctomycetes bacterium]|nr:hypothetical protein [Planctomycetota bacterium]